MSFFLNLKQNIGKLFPSKVVEAVREVQGSNLNENLRIALIFPDVDEGYLRDMKRYLQKLKGLYGVREALILTYIDCFEKDLPIYLSKLKELDYFTKDDLNWRLRPVSAIKGFCNKQYDVLIDLTMDKCGPIEHIVANSRAKMKVCRKGAINQKFADVIIDISEKNSDHEYLVYVEEILSKLSFK